MVVPLSWIRFRRSTLALALAGGAALVAATWLVAQLSWQGRLRTLEAELSLLRRTRQIDVPRLLNDLERLAGPVQDRLAFQTLQQRHSALEREHRSTLQALEALRRSRRLEERFLRRRQARPEGLLAELRTFYRLGRHAKLRHAEQWR